VRAVEILVRAVVSLVTASALVLPAERPTAGAIVASAAVGPSNWTWPVPGPILDPFDPPDTPFGAGHRGIDIAASPGTTVVAPEAAVVTFAGKVGGHLFVTLDHGGGLESTYSWVGSVLVRRGDLVGRAQPIATTGFGHPGKTPAHLHLGVRLADAYQDPLGYLGPVSVSSFIRLAPTCG